MMFRLVSLLTAASAAEVSDDAISLLQLRAAKREDTDTDSLPAEEGAMEGNGFCGLGILTDMEPPSVEAQSGSSYTLEANHAQECNFRFLSTDNDCRKIDLWSGAGVNQAFELVDAGSGTFYMKTKCGSYVSYPGDCSNTNIDTWQAAGMNQKFRISQGSNVGWKLEAVGRASCDARFVGFHNGCSNHAAVMQTESSALGWSPLIDGKAADNSVTLGALVAKFEARCEGAQDPDTGLQLYSTVLCEQLRQTLAQGIDLEEKADSGGDGPQKLCAELKRLTQAHFDHEVQDVDQAVQRKETVTPCVADVDCNGHGTTADSDSKDGCVCQCLDGWSNSDCSQEPVEADATQDEGKAIDDPHLTSVHGTHFDLYASGKYTLLSVPRHATRDDADLIVTAYVEKIGDRKNDLWIRRMAVSGKWVGEHYSFKTSSGSFGSEGTHLVRIGHGDWLSPAAAQAEKPASFRVLPHKEHEAPAQDFSQSISDRVELQCGPVTALIRWATVQKNGEDVNHIDFRMSGLHNLGENVGGLLVDEFDAE